MTREPHERPVTRFRPTSKDDFSARAKHLAWLIEQPLQVTQNFLARAYGYADLHDLQKDLERASAHPEKHPPGPYEEDLSSLFLSSSKEESARAYDGKIPISVRRDNHLLQSVADLKGTDLKGLSARDWDIREIGLFRTPEAHGLAFREIKGKHEVLRGGTKVDGSKSAGDYATAAPTRSDDDEFQLEFTRAGGAVWKALQALADEYEDGPVDDHKAQLEKLLKQHPENPWVHSSYVGALAEPCLQFSWAGNGRRDNWGPADPNYKAAAPHFARDLLPHVTKAVALFEQLYGDKVDRLAPKKLMSWSKHGCDSFHYPAILATGGWIAANAGQWSLAQTLLTKALKADPGGTYFCEDLLATVNLNVGSGPVAQLFSKDRLSMWGSLCKMAKELRDEEYDAAATHLSDWLKSIPTSLTAVDGKYRAADGVRVRSNVESLGAMQEFFFRTGDFWRRHPEAMDWLKRVTSDKGLRKAFAAYHADRENRRVFVGAMEHPGFDEAFEAAVEAALPSPALRS
ncbi:hypothetical protein [Bosea sp. ANAM02]|uniref:hypothetical protein n=1 Tax=Bosea sp. ANAM02 TaxID=2020412 RepID=UPI00140F0775|nr:hypothetical protein [Bosea sp. ANAM02]BCB22373.1 hypothetical protein OCUBac02_52670 [Bosea sp. ANAM02]